MNTRALLPLGLLALLALLGLAQAGELKVVSDYPQPTFLRHFYPADHHRHSYCVEDGSDGTAQGLRSQQGQLTQSCYGAQIQVYPNRVPEQFGVGLVGRLGVSIVNLGTEASLWQKYKKEDEDGQSCNMYHTLQFQVDNPEEPFRIGSGLDNETRRDVVWTALETSDWVSLNKTKFVGDYADIQDDHIYLARVTEEAADGIYEDNVVIIKIHVVSLLPRTLRWSVLAYDSRLKVPRLDFSLPKDFAESDTADQAKAVATGALILALVALVVIVIMALKLRKLSRVAAAGSDYDSVNSYRAAP